MFGDRFTSGILHGESIFSIHVQRKYYFSIQFGKLNLNVTVKSLFKKKNRHGFGFGGLCLTVKVQKIVIHIQ